MKKLFFLLTCILYTMTSTGQNVGIGTDDPQAKLDVNGGIRSNSINLAGPSDDYRILAVGAPIGILDQQQTNFNGIVGPGVCWQSFTAGVNGILTKIALFHFEHLSTNMLVYNGEGINGTLLATIPFESAAGNWSDSPPLNIPVQAGNQYTVSLSNAVNWAMQSPGQYPGGQNCITTDMAFKTFVGTESSDFMVDSSGNVLIGGNMQVTGSASMDGDLIMDEGNIGLGTSNPSVKLHLSGPDGKIRIDGGTGTTPYFNFGGSGEFAIDAVNVPGGRFVIKNSGKIGIGTSAPVAALHIQTNETPANSFGIMASGGLAGNACIEIRGNGGIPYLDFANDSTIDFDGRLILTSDNRFTMQGADLYIGDGPVYATAFNVISDQRLKKDIEEVHFAISEIDEMKVYNYYYTDDNQAYSLSDALQTGLMAQEVELVYPHAVTTDSEGMKAIDYGKLTPLLLDYIKQLKSENDSLKKDLENVRMDIEWIKTKVKL